MSGVARNLGLRLVWDNPITGEYHECVVDSLPVTIGRAPSLNAIVLNNKMVSRQHARLEDTNGKIVLIDQNSTNGTFVQGQRIKSATLQNNVCFQIGPFKFIGSSLEQTQ